MELINKTHKDMNCCRRKLMEEEQSVIARLPNPFGSFEKATYVLSNTHKFRKNIYSFTTTVHNTEDVINLMKEMIERRSEDQGRNFVIHKKQNGITSKIFSYNKFIERLNRQSY